MPNSPEWAPQLGSVSERHIAEHLGPEANRFVETIRIQTVTLSKLLQLYPLPRFDLLHVDAEGHDFNILMGLRDLSEKPGIILFEHKHLGFWKMAWLMMRICGNYQLLYTDTDVLAVAKRHSANPTA